jgi:hypothetical protein
MQPMHLQLTLIVFATIFHLWPFFVINNVLILHSKIIFIHDHAQMSH